MPYLRHYAVVLGEQGEVLKTNTFNVHPARSMFLYLDADTDMALAANKRHQIRALFSPIVADARSAGQARPLSPNTETAIVRTSTMSIPAESSSRDTRNQVRSPGNRVGLQRETQQKQGGRHKAEPPQILEFLKSTYGRPQ